MLTWIIHKTKHSSSIKQSAKNIFEVYILYIYTLYIVCIYSFIYMIHILYIYTVKPARFLDHLFLESPS
jgi:hypothetical protein